MDEPVAVVKAFIADHFRWNRTAYERDPTASDEAAVEATKREWAALLARFCRPGFVGEPISYGIPYLHDPAREVIVSATPRGNRCLVKTQMTADVGGMDSITNFEYRLSRVDGRWYLESIKCVFEDGKYESL